MSIRARIRGSGSLVEATAPSLTARSQARRTQPEVVALRRARRLASGAFEGLDGGDALSRALEQVRSRRVEARVAAHACVRCELVARRGSAKRAGSREARRAAIAGQRLPTRLVARPRTHRDRDACAGVRRALGARALEGARSLGEGCAHDLPHFDREKERLASRSGRERSLRRDCVSALDTLDVDDPVPGEKLLRLRENAVRDGLAIGRCANELCLVWPREPLGTDQSPRSCSVTANRCMKAMWALISAGAQLVTRYGTPPGWFISSMNFIASPFDAPWRLSPQRHDQAISSAAMSSLLIASIARWTRAAF